MSEERTPTANIAPFGLRMQPELKERVEKAAKVNNRSMNAEIVATLEDKYPPPSPFSWDDVLHNWIAPIHKLADPEERRARVREADLYVKQHEPNGFVEFREPDGEIVFGMRPRPVSDEEWNEAQNVLREATKNDPSVKL